MSDKVSGKDKVHLIENNKLLKTDFETAEVSNSSLSNVVQNLDYFRYSND